MNLTPLLNTPTARTRLAQLTAERDAAERKERQARIDRHKLMLSKPPPDRESPIVGLMMLGMIVFYAVLGWVLLF